MPTRSADFAFSNLKDFQRDTVAYVLRRLYDDPEADRTDRFLVADEVGMGKTLVARGVIAGAIERLQHDPSVRRIDIVYICSNAEIARQNISKLDVRGDGTRPLSTRMTMLATQLRDLNRKMPDGSKTVNLVAFTPGTSFDQGHRGGQISERALLAWLLIEPGAAEEAADSLVPRGRKEINALHRILRMEVSEHRWVRSLQRLASEDHAPDPSVAAAFRADVRGTPELAELLRLIEEVAGRYRLREAQRKLRRRVIGQLRHRLARVSVGCLEPDLVILDEFQRFKHLLETPDEDTEREVSRLAHDLFTAPQVKVLLLSATPYKLFTLAEERELSGDDHYGDFLATFEFLSSLRQTASVSLLKSALTDFRRKVVVGDDPRPAKEWVETLLRQAMCRTERPVTGAADMIKERQERPAAPRADDLVGFVAMKRIAAEVGGALSVEYWKSAPYFLNFMDGYQLSEKYRHHRLDDGRREQLLAGAQIIRSADVADDRTIEPGNSRLRQLFSETVDRGLWRLLWLPPSMPYYAAGGVFADLDPAAPTPTKRLILSSWAAAPSAIAALLSWTAMQRMRQSSPSRDTSTPRLTYQLDGGRASGMTTLALFAPTPGLAELTDPLDFARRSPREILPATKAMELAMDAVRPHIPPPRPARAPLSRDTWLWAAPFAIGSSGLEYADLAGVISEKDTTTEDRGLVEHLKEADRARDDAIDLGAQPPELERWVALLGLAGPANAAWRALRRVAAGAPDITPTGVWQAAAVIGAGFRSLFNRPEVMAMLDGLPIAEGLAYWQVVLEYCYSGNLQAVLDEYLHHLIGNENPSDDGELVEMTSRIRAVLALRTAPVLAFDPAEPGTLPIRFNTRFALRYGSAKGTLKSDEQSQERSADVQAAFNSPFWPMVLASTSVGQEGVDFHWWCHSLVHWNLPANPVDFEQREGRVHRFKGHAVRKNVAQEHRAEALRASTPDPWGAAFAAAEARRPPNHDDLWPWWVYPGTSKIERWIPSFPLSKDLDRQRVLQRQRALYRLVFGQSRQEDLLCLLDMQGYADDAARLAELRIDLRPPRRAELHRHQDDTSPQPGQEVRTTAT